MTSIIAPGTDGFGTDVGIHTQNPNSIQVVYRAQFFENAWCLGDKTRRYLVIQENAVEQNHPKAYCCLPGNCCCPGNDFITKYYFDRGPYDQQNCWWKIGFYSGAPSFFPNEVQYVCCCADAPECINSCMSCLQTCYMHNCCGDRVRVLPADTICWCCPTHACFCHNNCGCWGPKNGQPLPGLLVPYVCCLKPGSANDLVVATENARSAWRQRTGKA